MLIELRCDFNARTPEMEGSGVHAHCSACVSRRCKTRAAPGIACELLACPASCGAVFHACKSQEHRLLCPQERVPCLNAAYGCPLTLARRSVGSHLRSCPASVVCCTMEWNRWPVRVGENQRRPHETQGATTSGDSTEQLDMALAQRDQRMLLESLKVMTLFPELASKVALVGDSSDDDVSSVASGSSSATPSLFLPPSASVSVSLSDGEAGPAGGTLEKLYRASVETTRSLAKAYSILERATREMERMGHAAEQPAADEAQAIAGPSGLTPLSLAGKVPPAAGTASGIPAARDLVGLESNGAVGAAVNGGSDGINGEGASSRRSRRGVPVVGGGDGGEGGGAPAVVPARREGAEEAPAAAAASARAAPDRRDCAVPRSRAPLSVARSEESLSSCDSYVDAVDAVDGAGAANAAGDTFLGVANSVDLVNVVDVADVADIIDFMDTEDATEACDPANGAWADVDTACTNGKSGSRRSVHNGLVGFAHANGPTRSAAWDGSADAASSASAAASAAASLLGAACSELLERVESLEPRAEAPVSSRRWEGEDSGEPGALGACVSRRQREAARLRLQLHGRRPAWRGDGESPARARVRDGELGAAYANGHAAGPGNRTAPSNGEPVDGLHQLGAPPNAPVAGGGDAAAAVVEQFPPTWERAVFAQWRPRVFSETDGSGVYAAHTGEPRPFRPPDSFRRCYLGDLYRWKRRMQDKSVDTGDLARERRGGDDGGVGEVGPGIDLVTAALLFCLDGESPCGRGVSDRRVSPDGARTDTGTQTFSLPSAVLATRTMVGEMASAPACDHASPQLSNPSPFPRLGLDLVLECVTRYQAKPRSMFTFVCGQLFRRDEFPHHFKNVHGDIHAGLNGWLEQRCPLAHYGCPYTQQRLCPSAPGAKVVHSTRLGSFGVLPFVPPEHRDYGRSAAPSPIASSSDDDDDRARPAPALGDSGERDRLSRLPLEVLQQVARRLDGYSLCQLSLVSRLLRDVCSGVLPEKGMVTLVWERRRRLTGAGGGGGSSAWRVKHKVRWLFARSACSFCGPGGSTAILTRCPTVLAKRCLTVVGDRGGRKVAGFFLLNKKKRRAQFRRCASILVLTALFFLSGCKESERHRRRGAFDYNLALK
ncbi:F-box only protein 30-like isoform X1 [Petromyzon marinus]|uniref:F-box only protein 30-like isoform X1 n=1 Tax=Petromyzon marinus TaxID=7757 RepID=UPI003F72F475